MRAGRGLTLTWQILGTDSLLVVPTYLLHGEAAWVVGRGRVPGVFGVPAADLLSGPAPSTVPGLAHDRSRRARGADRIAEGEPLTSCADG
jgi:hypothetical protein